MSDSVALPRAFRHSSSLAFCSSINFGFCESYCNNIVPTRVCSIPSSVICFPPTNALQTGRPSARYFQRVTQTSRPIACPFPFHLRHLPIYASVVVETLALQYTVLFETALPSTKSRQSPGRFHTNDHTVVRSERQFFSLEDLVVGLLTTRTASAMSPDGRLANRRQHCSCRVWVFSSQSLRSKHLSSIRPPCQEHWA